jgi:hypothetical protein
MENLKIPLILYVYIQYSLHCINQFNATKYIHEQSEKLTFNLLR